MAASQHLELFLSMLMSPTACGIHKNGTVPTELGKLSFGFSLGINANIQLVQSLGKLLLWLAWDIYKVMVANVADLCQLNSLATQ